MECASEASIRSSSLGRHLSDRHHESIGCRRLPASDHHHHSTTDNHHGDPHDDDCAPGTAAPGGHSTRSACGTCSTRCYTSADELGRGGPVLPSGSGAADPGYTAGSTRGIAGPGQYGGQRDPSLTDRYNRAGPGGAAPVQAGEVVKRLVFAALVLLVAAGCLIGPPKASAVSPLIPGTVPVPSANGSVLGRQMVQTVPIGTWETQLLVGLHAPVTATNIAALDVWADSEGVLEHNNPLASSGVHFGATHCIAQCVHNGSPVYAYIDMTDGVAANVGFLYGSNYDGVRAAFQASAGLMGVWRAINRSRWCSGCQSGLYPIDLYRAAHSASSIPPVVLQSAPPIIAPVP